MKITTQFTPTEVKYLDAMVLCWRHYATQYDMGERCRRAKVLHAALGWAQRLLDNGQFPKHPPISTAAGAATLERQLFAPTPTNAHARASARRGVLSLPKTDVRITLSADEQATLSRIEQRWCNHATGAAAGLTSPYRPPQRIRYCLRLLLDRLRKDPAARWPRYAPKRHHKRSHKHHVHATQRFDVEHSEDVVRS